MIGIGIGVTYRWRHHPGGAPVQPAQHWFLAGDGTAPDIVVDATLPAGVSLDGGGSVSAILNLGKAADVSFLPTGATNSPITLVAGRMAVQFDGGGAYQPYQGGATYATGAFDTTRKLFALQAVSQSALTGDQIALSTGAAGSASPRVNFVLKGNGVSNTVEHHNGSTVRTYNGEPIQRVTGQVTVQAAFHNGVGELSAWANGAAVAFRETSATITGMANDPAPATNIVTLGAVANGVWDLNGALLGAAFDNAGDLSLEAAYAKYNAAFTHFGRTGRPAFAIWSLGQSNAQAAFPNPAPLTFAPETGYYRQRTGSYNQVFKRSGFGHTGIGIGTSSPAVYFADEWQKLTAQVPVFQELAFSGQPITPGLAGKTNYWAPRNAEGDAAGDTSLMETWNSDFRRFSDLLDHSPEFDLLHNIALIIEGEADAAGYNNGENVTVPRLVGFMNAWLDDLRDLYGITTFAIVNIGRSGSTEAAAAANAPGVQVVRDAWSQVIAARPDAFDVFPHLVPSGPFAIDNLVVDQDGAWVSGVGYQADGLHYTTAMYQAVGRIAARTLFAQIGL